MSDERLRELERRVAANPEDFVAGHELVRELERAGDRAGARRELARLARRGDREAWQVIARTTAPRPSEYFTGIRQGLSPPMRVSASRSIEGRWEFMGADDDNVFVVVDSELLALDNRTLAAGWTELGEVNDACLAADRYLVLNSTQDITVRDASSGLLLWTTDGRFGAAGAGGHLVAAIETPEPDSDWLVLLDVASGRDLWKRPIVGLGAKIAVAEDRVVLTRHEGEYRSLEVFDVANGERVLVRDVPGKRLHFLGLDSRAVAYHDGARLLELDLDDGSERSATRVADFDRGHMGREHLVLIREGEIELVSRSGRGSLWRAPIDVVARFGCDVLIAGDFVWTAVSRGDGATIVRPFELHTGLDVKTEVIRSNEGSPCGPKLIPLDGAVLVLNGTAESLTVTRFEPA